MQAGIDARYFACHHGRGSTVGALGLASTTLDSVLNAELWIFALACLYVHHASRHKNKVSHVELARAHARSYLDS